MTQPVGLASLNPGTGTVLYGKGQLGSIRLKTGRLPAFSNFLYLFYALTDPYTQKHVQRRQENTGMSIVAFAQLDSATHREYWH